MLSEECRDGATVRIAELALTLVTAISDRVDWVSKYMQTLPTSTTTTLNLYLPNGQRHADANTSRGTTAET